MFASTDKVSIYPHVQTKSFRSFQTSVSDVAFVKTVLIRDFCANVLIVVMKLEIHSDGIVSVALHYLS